MKAARLIRLFIRPRTLPFPTACGWLLLLVLFLAPFAAWCFRGEDLLCRTRRETADVLVVEGWAGEETFEAAAGEFLNGHYRWIVTTGGPSGDPWSRKRWTYAEIARDRLITFGVPGDRIIMAPAPEVSRQRTHEAAVCALRAMTGHNLRPAAINLYTRGAHARRSHLVYAKVFAPDTKVGVISWLPGGAHAGPWWRSTLRAKDLLTETIGYLYEALLDSGRTEDTRMSARLSGDPSGG